jgi:hypothetical protein
MIQTTHSEAQIFELYDMEGRIVKTVEVKLKSEISLESLEAGTYLMRSSHSNQVYRIIKN